LRDALSYNASIPLIARFLESYHSRSSLRRRPFLTADDDVSASHEFRRRRVSASITASPSFPHASLSICAFCETVAFAFMISNFDGFDDYRRHFRRGIPRPSCRLGSLAVIAGDIASSRERAAIYSSSDAHREPARAHMRLHCYASFSHFLFMMLPH